jgi:glycosyltransferase involved in cell wall biosynthesis
VKLTAKQTRIIERFNKPGTHLVISRWPEKNSTYDGIATYTKDIVTRFSRKYKDKFVVLAEKTSSKEKNTELVKPNVLIIRAFNERRFHIYPQILYWLKFFKKVRRVYVHSEFCASGGPVLRFLVVPFLGLIKLFKKDVTFYAHNVVKSLSGYEQHLGYENNYWKFIFIGFGYRWYFKLLSILVDRFVVLEPVIAKWLKMLTSNKPIFVEPHWVASIKQKMTQDEAKKKLGIKKSSRLVVSFGFVTHYKGADFIANFAEWLTNQGKLKNIQLVLAGGKSYSLKNKKYYQRYYSQIEDLAAKLKNLTLTGFLSEKEVSLWLTAADIVIFPYRNLMGGSGALQQALRYNKPILMSQSMANRLEVKNLQIAFIHQYQSLANQLRLYFKSDKNKKAILNFTKNYASQLKVEKLQRKHFEDVYQADIGKKSVKKTSIKLLKWNRKIFYEISPVKA